MKQPAPPPLDPARPPTPMPPAPGPAAPRAADPARSGPVEPPKPLDSTPRTGTDSRRSSPVPGTRLPSLPKTSVGGAPRPTQEQIQTQSQFIGSAVEPQYNLQLILGQPRLVLLKNTPTRIQIGDPGIADYELLDPKTITLIGKQSGTTVLNLFFTDPNDNTKQTILSYLVAVIPDPNLKERLEHIYKALEDEINETFPDSWVCLRLVGDKLVISGQAKDIAEATAILRTVRSQAPNDIARVPIDGTDTLSLAATEIYGPDALLSPTLRHYLLQGGNNVINLLRIPGEQQVMLKVTVAEVSRAAARVMGVNFSITNNQGITVFSQLTGNITGNLSGLLDNGQISLQISALRSLNYARTLAEPNLVTLNGSPAFFSAGGSFPIPVTTLSGGGTATGVQFQQYGIQLQFTPYITDKDRIRLQINAGISDRDLATGADIGGTNVPGLVNRGFTTFVEMREGQTLAVAGLLERNLGATSARVPLLGDLPIFGRLWSVDGTSAGEKELVILVTPELVHPLEHKEIPPLPGSDLFEPGDLEFFLFGRLESRRAYDYRSQVMTDIHRMARYRHCEQLYIIGPHGHSDGYVTPPPPPLPGMMPGPGPIPGPISGVPGENIEILPPPQALPMPTPR